jgi:hypothetical protein
MPTDANAKTPIAEPAAPAAERLDGLPRWCGGMRYVASRNTLVLLVDLPVALIVPAIARHLGAWAPLGPMPGAVRFELELDPAQADVLAGGLARIVEHAQESAKIIEVVPG